MTCVATELGNTLHNTALTHTHLQEPQYADSMGSAGSTGATGVTYAGQTSDPGQPKPPWNPCKGKHIILTFYTRLQYLRVRYHHGTRHVLVLILVLV